MPKQVHVQWMGDGPISFPLPGSASTYTLKPKIRNVIDGDVWAALINPTDGPALPYLSAKRLRVTTPGGGADAMEVAKASRLVSPVRPTQSDAETEALRERLAQMEARLARMVEKYEPDPEVYEFDPDAGPDDEPEAAPESAPESDHEPNGGDDLPDPGSMSVAKLAKAIEGLGADALELVLEAEKAGKNRSGAVDMLTAALAKAGGDEG